jgi:hypothetical protein
MRCITSPNWLKSILLSVVALNTLAPTALLAVGNFPATYQIGGNSFEKRGEYRYVYRVFFKLYDAALYVKPSASPQDIFDAKIPFHLSFHYLRTIEKSIILDSADKMLNRNLSDPELRTIADRVDKINAAYQTVENGDRSSLTYEPDVGTTLKINDRPVITIEGEDFAQLYFQIWLGENPISSSMKAVLIGEKGG